MIRVQHLLALSVAAVVAACGTADKDRERGDVAAHPGMPMDSPGGMQGMPGMHGQMGGMASSGMMDEMQQHMQWMMGAGTDSMQVMMPMHRQMTANMLSAMNREMRDMNMTVDSAWSATVDSVRQDLVRLPELSGSELRAFMPAHRERVNRLMEMHRSMMADMKM